MAVLLVVAYHAGVSFPGGYVGVDVFFVISGFVVAKSLVREWIDDGRIQLGRFYRRRARRLLPALATMMVVCLLLGSLILSPSGSMQAAARTALAGTFALANAQLYAGGGYFDPNEELNPFLHLWSLSVEEQFYFVLAIVLAGSALALRRRSELRVPLLWLGAVAVVGSFLLSWGATDGWLQLPVDNAQRWAFYSPFTRAWEFGVGVALALANRRLFASSSRWWGWAAALGLALIFSAGLGFADDTSFPGLAALVPVVGAALLILTGDLPSFTSRLLCHPLLTRLGDLSYSWYLWHWPLIVFAAVMWPANPIAAVCVAVGSLAPAWMSAQVLEGRSRRTPSAYLERDTCERFGSVFRIGLLGVGLPAACAMVVLSFANGAWGPAVAEEVLLRSEARERGCHGDLDDPILDPPVCTWQVVEDAELLMLVGDSQAISIADTVIAAGNDAGFNVLVQTRSLCPFHERRVLRRGCAGYQRETRSLIKELRPRLVVVANRSPAYVRTPVGELLLPIVDQNDKPVESNEDGLLEWRDGLHSTIDEISASGSSVLIIHTVPEFESSTGATSVSVIKPNGVSERRSLEDVGERRNPTLKIERQIAAEFTEVWTFDPLPYLCTETCDQRRDGRWLYYDDDHVSVLGAELLEVSLHEAFDGLTAD